MLKYIIVIIQMICITLSWAQAPSDQVQSKNQEAEGLDSSSDYLIVERARKRLYAGGGDEEDLQVQSHLLKPKPKKSDEFEVEEAPAQQEEEF